MVLHRHHHVLRTLLTLLLAVHSVSVNGAEVKTWKFDPFQEPIARTELLSKLKKPETLSPEEHEKLLIRAERSLLLEDAMLIYERLSRKSPGALVFKSAFALSYFRAIQPDYSDHFPLVWKKRMNKQELYDKAFYALEEPLKKQTKIAFCWRAGALAYNGTVGPLDRDQALARYRKALELDPNSAVAYRGLAWLHLRGVKGTKHHDPKAALEASEAAIRLAPRYAGAYSLKALSLDELGQPQRAYDTFQKALTLCPAKVVQDSATQWRLNFYKKKAQAQR